MKKTFLLLPIIGAFAYITLSSNHNGYGSNRTGSHGGTVGCGSGCHASTATAGVTMGIELDSAGVPVTHYKAGMSYVLKMTGTNTTTNTLPKFGAQLTVVSGSGSTSVDRGSTFSSVPTGMSTYTSKFWNTQLAFLQRLVQAPLVQHTLFQLTGLHPQQEPAR